MGKKFSGILTALLLLTMVTNNLAQVTVADQTSKPERIRIKIDRKGRLYDKSTGKQLDWRLFAFTKYVDGSDFKKGTARKRPAEMELDKNLISDNDLDDKSSANYKVYAEHLSAELKRRQTTSRTQSNTSISKKEKRVTEQKEVEPNVDLEGKLAEANRKMESVLEENRNLKSSLALSNERPIASSSKNEYMLTLFSDAPSTFTTGQSQTVTAVLSGKTAEGVEFKQQGVPVELVTDSPDNLEISGNVITAKAPGEPNVRAYHALPNGRKVESILVSVVVVEPLPTWWETIQNTASSMWNNGVDYAKSIATFSLLPAAFILLLIVIGIGLHRLYRYFKPPVTHSIWDRQPTPYFNDSAVLSDEDIDEIDDSEVIVATASEGPPPDREVV